MSHEWVHQFVTGLGALALAGFGFLVRYVRAYLDDMATGPEAGATWRVSRLARAERDISDIRGYLNLPRTWS